MRGILPGMLLLLALVACDGADPKPSGPDDTGAPDSGDTGDDTGSVASACPPLEDVDATWQIWDDADVSASMKDLRGNGWTGSEGFYDYYREPSWEAVRFELGDPSCVYAVQVAWAEAPAGDAPAVGLYPDFGENGFDFHSDQPLWVATAAEGADDGTGWVTYTLDAPLEMATPGLLYAASFRDGNDGPTLAMDLSYVGDGACAAWDDCHSALNYPDADAGSYYNGTSFGFPYDFAVRLLAAPTATKAEEDRWFHAVETGFTAGHGAWGDYDDDGDDDLMVPGLSLWRNDGGTFTNVTAEAGVGGAGTGGGVWGDYDNDGCLDFFGFNEGYTGGESLLRSNCDGTFTDRIAESGIDDTQTSIDCDGDASNVESASTTGAAWIDFDNDGLLDLAMANHICWNSPERYYPDRFWHNQGDGTFVEWGEEHGLFADEYATRGVGAVDADLDGDVDLAMNNYRLQPNFYWRNDGGTFVEASDDVGLRGKGTEISWNTVYYGHTIGLVWGDLDNDGDWDQVASNLAHPRFYHFSDRTNVLIQHGGVWTDEADARGIVYRETHSNPALLDFENDGDLDLLITEVYEGRPTDVYVNDGSAHFQVARWDAGILTENGWGTAVSDYDGDGDEDVLVTSLYRNDTPDTGHWVKLRLVGDVASNRAGIGAIAWVVAGGKTYMRTVQGGSGTGNQDSQTLHFGLGDATTIDGVTVWWPGGDTVDYTGVAVDGGWRLTESGTATAGLGAAR